MEGDEINFRLQIEDKLIQWLPDLYTSGQVHVDVSYHVQRVSSQPQLLCGA